MDFCSYCNTEIVQATDGSWNGFSYYDLICCNGCDKRITRTSRTRKRRSARCDEDLQRESDERDAFNERLEAHFSH